MEDKKKEIIEQPKEPLIVVNNEQPKVVTDNHVSIEQPIILPEQDVTQKTDIPANLVAPTAADAPTPEKPKGKPFRFTKEIAEKQKRLGATGIRVDKGEVKYLIPKKKRELNEQLKNHKKKMDKIRKESRRRNRK